jgi:hypothetical protein
MWTRCTNNKFESYGNYGGRGIEVCKRWRSFENFIIDMGEKPNGLSLDRINNDKGYSKKNCRWATSKEQCRNRRSNNFLTFQNETLCVTEWENRLNISSGTIHKRINIMGWSLSRALTTPSNRKEKTPAPNEVACTTL